MKLLLLTFIVALNFFPIKTNKALLVGFKNFINSTSTNTLEFDILFKNKTKYQNVYFNITVSNGTNTKEYELSCSRMIVEKENDISYHCMNNSVIFNSTINVTASPIFLFKNSTTNITKEDIVQSSLANATINNIQDQTKDISYDTFYLSNVVIENNNITLNGYLNKVLSEERNIALNLGEKKYDLQVSNNTIKFHVVQYIDEHLHGNMGTNDNITYTLIYANETINDLVYYVKPESNLFVELIGAGAFKKEARQNAKGLIYIRGSPELLKSLRKYIRFTASARNRTSKLRNLQDSKTVNVTATGVKISNESSSIAIYNVTYTNSSNTNFTDLTPNNDFEFSQTEDFRFPEHQITKAVNTKLNLTETNTETPEEIILKKHPYHKTPSSFEFDFNVSNPLNLTENQTNAYMKYPIRIGSYDEEEIACTLINNVINNGYYKIKCSTKNTIYALMKDLKILVPKKSSRKRILAGETNINKTLLFPADANHIMEYEYSVEPNSFNPRANKNTGLTAGAIVAIVLSTVAAVVAVGIVLFFLNRIKSTPPVLNKTNDFNMVNSTSNMNH